MAIKFDPQDTFATKDEIKSANLLWRETPDVDFIRIKTKIKYMLIQCPRLLYSLHNVDYESELFDDTGNLKEEGEWDRYLDDNIRPYLFYPETQTNVKNYISFKVEFDEYPTYNSSQRYCDITFVVMVDGKDINQANGIPRHDEISAILIDRFAWSNAFGTHCKLISSSEGYTDTNYVTRTLVFRLTNLNSMQKTRNGKTTLINTSEVRN